MSLLFRNKFNKNNTGARMLDSLYHMTLVLFFFILYLAVKSVHIKNI